VRLLAAFHRVNDKQDFTLLSAFEIGFEH